MVVSIEKTDMHMRWHKGVRENDELMVHPSDGDARKALDTFDPYFEGLWQTIVHKKYIKGKHISLVRKRQDDSHF
jgi:hypothetical protein